MEKMRKYLEKSNTELNPNINPSERILYYYDKHEEDIFNELKKDLRSEFSKNILLGGNRGCGKSSLVNAVVDYTTDLVLKIDCSLVDEIEDLLTLIVLEIGTIKFEPMNENENDIEKLKNSINSIICTSKHVNTSMAFEELQESNENDNSLSAEFLASLHFFNSRAKVQENFKKIFLNKQKTEKLHIQERINPYFERKKELEKLIDQIRCITRKKIVLILDEIDKQESNFLEKVFDKYKSFFTSGKSTNIFIVNMHQYYYAWYGNLCKNIENYFDKKYFMRSISFLTYKNFAYNDITNYVDLISNYFVNEGNLRKSFEANCHNANNPLLLFKYELFINIAEYIDGFSEYDDFIKEILIGTINKVLKVGIVDYTLDLNKIGKTFHDYFLMFDKIQLDTIMNSFFKEYTFEKDYCEVEGEKIIFKKEAIIMEYKKIMQRNFALENTADFWRHQWLEEDEVQLHNYVNLEKYKDVNAGQIKLLNFDKFQFIQICDNNNAYADIIKTFKLKKIAALITLERNTNFGSEYGYLVFIQGPQYNGNYVLYYQAASWSFDSTHIKDTIDSFISKNCIKEVIVEEEKIILEKMDLKRIVEKYNANEKVSKYWVIINW